MSYQSVLIDHRDVAYVAASGSVLAAAGCSSNGANVVIWDTLAPPATCQTSIMCHEGISLSYALWLFIWNTNHE